MKMQYLVDHLMWVTIEASGDKYCKTCCRTSKNSVICNIFAIKSSPQQNLLSATPDLSLHPDNNYLTDTLSRQVRKYVPEICQTSDVFDQLGSSKNHMNEYRILSTM